MITEEEKIKGLEHVFYEICMLFYCSKNLNTQIGWHVQSCVIESYAVHLRTLRDFFEGKTKETDTRDAYAKDGKPCDILSQDYSFNKYILNEKITNRIFEDFINWALDKEIAHLTYRRFQPKNNWIETLPKTIMVIKPIIIEFLHHLKSHPKFKIVFDKTSKAHPKTKLYLENIENITKLII